MRIVIPTRGRVGRQTTLKYLPPDVRSTVTIVCPSDEVARHKRDWPDVTVVAQPDDSWRLGPKRQWIAEDLHRAGVERVCMMDDDLTFQVRSNPDDPKSLRAVTRTPNGLDLFRRYLRELAEMLSPDVPHASFGQKQHNDKKPGGWHGPGRCMQTLGFHLPTFHAVGVRMDRLPTRDDLDATLTLLRAGYTNMICNDFVLSPAGFGQPGGCSLYRDLEFSDNEAQALADLHPGYVRIAMRSYKKSMPRKEVTMLVQKALRDGLAARAAREAAA